MRSRRRAPTSTRSSRRSAARRRRSWKQSSQLFAIRVRERVAEVQQLPEDVVAGFEVRAAAVEMDEARRRELAFLVEDEADAPRTFRNRLAAVAARGLALRALGAVDARHALVGAALARGLFQRVAIGDLACRLR